MVWSGIEPCNENIATTGKFRPFHDSLLNELMSRNTQLPKIHGRESIICTKSQKLTLQRKPAESGAVYTMLLKVSLGLEKVLQAQL